MYRSTRKHFAADVRSVGQARTFVSAALSAWGRVERLDDLILCLSELASNALKHTDAPCEGFMVRLDADAWGVRLEVLDAHGGAIGVRHPANDETSGRGLLIVTELSDEWGVHRGTCGKSVWVRFHSGVAPGTRPLNTSWAAAAQSTGVMSPRPAQVRG